MEMLTSQEVAKLMGKTDRWIRELAKQGTFEGYIQKPTANKVSQYLIPVSSLEEQYQLKYLKNRGAEIASLTPSADMPRRPLDNFSQSEREEMSFWIEIIERWQSYRNAPMVTKKTEVDERFEVLLGRIVTANPLSIEINGQTIKKYLYINPAFTVLADDSADKIKAAFDDTLKLEGGMDGIQRQPKNRAETSVIDRYINVEYTVNPIVHVAWYDFLLEFHQKFVIKKGDEVIVIHIGVSFSIVSKVVTA